MVEFALILPVLVLLLVGIIEFGSIYSDVISMRQGVREAGRQGSVARFSSASCALNPITAGTLNSVQQDVQSPHITTLMCMAKNQVGVGDGVYFKVRYVNYNNPAAPTYSDEANDYKVGNGLVICAVYPLRSLTRLFQPFLDAGNKAARTKAVFRIEQVSSIKEIPGAEALPTGQTWSFCA